MRLAVLGILACLTENSDPDGTLMAKSPSQTPLKRSLQVLLPSIFTVARIVCGFFAIVFTCSEMHLLGAPSKSTLSGIAFDNAAKTIGWAILFDGLDGRVARLMRSDSPFGLQFDSLADVVTFGMDPAVLLFAWGVMPIHDADRTSHSETLYVAGWIVACVF